VTAGALHRQTFAFTPPPIQGEHRTGHAILSSIGTTRLTPSTSAPSWPNMSVRLPPPLQRHKSPGTGRIPPLCYGYGIRCRFVFGLESKARKQFFFEKKDQKTFTLLADAVRKIDAYRKSNNFLVLFPKKNCFICAYFLLS
jgi:hypothetical protein